MDNSIYIRPLLISDANKTLEWDSDPDRWLYDSEERHRFADLETEKAWLTYRLEKTSDKCFAICTNFSDQHVGNIELTNINPIDARCEVFIGDKALSEEAIAKSAIVRIADYAFSYLKLNEIYADVHREHLFFLSAFKKCGFESDGLQNTAILRLHLHRNKYSGINQ